MHYIIKYIPPLWLRSILMIFLNIIGCGLMIDLSRQTVLLNGVCSATAIAFGFLGFILLFNLLFKIFLIVKD